MKGFLKHFKTKKEEQEAASLARSEGRSMPSGTGVEPEGARPDTVLPGQRQDAGASQKIVLELGDILHRIPPHLLKEGAHDPSQRIFFRMNDLSANLAGGKATIPLSSIAARCPEIFRHEIGPDDDVEIFFPWSKLLDRVRNLKAMIDQPTTDKNPAMHYRSGGPATPAIRLRPQNPRENLPSLQMEQKGSDTPAPTAAMPAPATGEPAKDEIVGAPIDGPADASASTASTEPVLGTLSPQTAPKKSKQNWFSAPAPASTKSPATDEPAPLAGLVAAPSSPSITAPAIKAETSVQQQASTPAAKTKSLSLGNDPVVPPARVLKMPGQETPSAAATSPAATASAPAPVEQPREAASKGQEEKEKGGSADPRAREIQQKLIEKLTNEREEAANENNKLLVQIGETRVEFEKKLQTLREDHAKQLTSLREERDRAIKEKAGAVQAQPPAPPQPDPALVAAAKQKDEEIARLAGTCDELKKKVEALGKERDEIRDLKAKIDAELTQSREAFQQEIEAALDARDTIWIEKDILSKELHDQNKAHAEKWDRIFAQHETLKAEHEKVRAEHEETKARLDRETQALREDFSKQIATLKEEHARAIAEKESLLSKHGEAADQQRNALLSKKEEALAKLAEDLEAHKKLIEKLAGERTAAIDEKEKLSGELAEAKKAHEQGQKASQDIRADFEKQIAALKEAHNRLMGEKETLLSKHGEAADRERNQMIREKDGAIAKLGAEIQNLKSELESATKARAAAVEAKEKLTAEFAQLKADLATQTEANVRERNTLAKQKDEQIVKLTGDIEAHKKQVEAISRERSDAINAKAKAAEETARVKAEAEKKAKSLQEDFDKRFSTLKAEHAKVVADKEAAAGKREQSVAQEHASLVKQKDASIVKLTTELDSVKKQLEATTKEREGVRDSKAKLESDLSQTREQHRKQLEAITKERDSVAKEKDLIASKLAEAVKAHTEKLNAASSERDKVLRAKDETLGQMKLANEAHAKETQALTRERDRLAKEVRQLQERLDEASKQGRQTQEVISQKTAEANRQRDEALARLESERKTHEKELARLQKQKETLTHERDHALSQHKEALESKRGQWTVFGKEYNQVVRQRDEALAKLAQASAEVEKKADNLSKEKEAVISDIRETLAAREKTIAELTQKIEDLTKQNEAIREELKAAKEAHEDEVGKLASERDEALRKQDDLMSLPRIRPIMIAPPSLQPVKPNA